ncbi:hypothetical protein Dimus_005527 [Dionaea muscipula]
MLVHVDAVKEFYAKMTVIHLKKKDVVKSSVKGIGIEFDHERLATILGVLEELESVNTSKRFSVVEEEIPAAAPQSSAQQKDQTTSGVDPSRPTGRIPEAEFLKFQAEFERKRANRFHDDLEKAKAENSRLLALLHQTQTKSHP